MRLIYDGNSLEHHGIKGQRWGVRRYQPYPKGHKGGKEIGEAAKMDSRLKKKIDEAAKMDSRMEKVRSMSDGELLNAINRLKMEKQYFELSGNSITQGESFVKNLLISIGTTAITTFATNLAVKGGQAAVAAIMKKATPNSVFNAIYKKK